MHEQKNAKQMAKTFVFRLNGDYNHQKYAGFGKKASGK